MSDEPTPRHVPCQCPECVGMADRIAELEAAICEHRRHIIAGTDDETDVSLADERLWALIDGGTDE